jgi:hypothetical protein
MSAKVKNNGAQSGEQVQNVEFWLGRGWSTNAVVTDHTNNE